MDINQNLARKLELESKLINIVKLNCVSNPNLATAGIVYCGRNPSRSSSGFNPLDLGLGNPYACKKSKNCVWAEIEGWCHMVQPQKNCDFLYHF